VQKHRAAVADQSEQIAPPLTIPSAKMRGTT